MIGGRSSVNTHTGSVGVAGPQSNTVKYCKNVSVEVSGSMKKSSTASSILSARLVSQSIFKKESAVQASSKGVKVQAKSKFDLEKLPGGKFNLKFTKKPQNKENENTSVQGGTLKFSNTPSRKQFRGENFNRIPIVSTPTKRSRESKSAICDEVSNCPGSLYATNFDQDTDFGSPAKRRKWGQ